MICYIVEYANENETSTLKKSFKPNQSVNLGITGVNALKIALISNPAGRRQKPDFPPPGIAYLGAMARQAGHEVLLIDGGLRSISQIVQEVKEASPDFIGVTCWTIDRNMVWKLCNALKNAVPDTFLAIGGTHATMFPEHIFAKTHASVVVIGEGEETFVELVDCLEKGEDQRKVAGIALQDESNNLFFTALRSPLRDLNAIPYPYYQGFRNFNFLSYKVFIFRN